MNKYVYEYFFDSTKMIIQDMTKIEVIPNGDYYEDEKSFSLAGVSSIVNFVGNPVKGRFLVDIEEPLVFEIVKNTIGKDCNDVKDDDVIKSISEINNAIASDAKTNINNELLSNLKLTKSIIFVGKSPKISTPKYKSITSNYNTIFGQLKVNVAFEEV